MTKRWRAAGAYPFIAGFLLESRDERTNINLRDLLKKVLITRDNRVDWKRLEQLLAISRSEGGDQEASVPL